MDKKRKVIIAIGLSIVLMIGIFCLWRKLNHADHSKDLDNIADINQPVYGALLWAQLCEKNGIPYEKSKIEDIKGLYRELVGNKKLNEELTVYNLALYICDKKLIGGNVEKELSLLQDNYWDPVTSFYTINSKQYYGEDQPMASLSYTKSIIGWFEKCGISVPDNVIKGLENYYNEYIDNIDELENKKDELIAIVYYFWDKDNCAGIDMHKQIVRKWFADIYEEYLITVKQGQVILDFNLEEKIKIWHEMGIDTTELENFTANWDLIGGDEEIWKTWKNVEEEEGALSDTSSAIITAALYYDILSDSQNTLKKNEYFCQEFGKGLNQYCEKTLIPLLYDKLGKENK